MLLLRYFFIEYNRYGIIILKHFNTRARDCGIAAVVTSRAPLYRSIHISEKAVACSTLFSDMAEQKGYTQPVFKKGSLPFFLSLCSIFIFIFPTSRHTLLVFFSPIDSPERPMAVPGLRKKCAGSYAHCVIFSHQTAASSVEKNVQKENPRVAVTGEDFFLSRKYHVRCGCAYVGVCVCVCKATMGFFVVVD